MEKLTALRVFRRVAELGSFTRAAKDLRLSNAGVSKNVRELEEELGVPLIQRTTRRLHLTSAGQAYYERVSAILDELGAADASLKDLRATPRGLLRVSAPMSLGIALLMPAVSDFLVRWPEIQVDLEMNDRFVDPIREGFDVCIRGAGELDDSTLVAKKLTVLERIVVAAPSYVAREHGRLRSPDDLRRHRCLVYSLSRTPTQWSFVRGKERRVIDIDGPLRVNNSLALARAAADGAGLALVPAFAVERDLARGRLVRVLDEWAGSPQTLHAVTPRHRESARPVRLFVEHVAAHLARRSA